MSYFESRLRLDFNNTNEIKRNFNICEKLGIRNLILEPKNNMKSISSELKNKIRDSTKINIYFRITLKLKDMEAYKKALKSFNNFSDILSVETPNKEIQLHAARDSRIDLVSFSEPNIMKTITPGVISLIKQNNTFIEFSIAPLLVENKANQSKNFRNLYRSLQMIRKKQVNYIISGDVVYPYDLRHPRSLISICHSLLALPLIEAKKAFQEYPNKLISRVHDRLNKNILETGVNLIEGGG